MFFKHLKATLQGNRSCRDRTIEIANKLLSAPAPAMPEVLASRLVALQKRKVFVPWLWVRCGCDPAACIHSSFVLGLVLPLCMYRLVLVWRGVHSAWPMHCELGPQLTWAMAPLQHMSDTRSALCINQLCLMKLLSGTLSCSHS